MRLTSKIIKNYVNLNAWEYSDMAYVREGEANTVYFQLVDLDRGIRYLSPESTLSINVVFPSIRSDRVFTVAATQVSPDDKSIWKVFLTPTQLPASGPMKFEFTENAAVKKWVVYHTLSVELLAAGSC